MKNIHTLILLLLLAVLPAGAAKKNIVGHIEPPSWWTGMANDTLQLMVYGHGLDKATVSTDYPGVAVDTVVRADSPDYLFIYMVLGKDTRPGEMPLKFTVGKTSQTVNYPLRPRTGLRPGMEGFDASDVLYLVMPDRFANGDTANDTGRGILRHVTPIDRQAEGARHGGDIAGMVRHMDYIDSLGVTAVWVNPVLENDMPGGSYHGYATTDFYRIDPRLGSNDEWKDFIARANDRGLKVVMDMIFNHCGSGHQWLANPPFADWFNFPDTTNYVETNHRLSTVHDPYASDYDRRRAVGGWFVPLMPDLNQLNPHLMTYLIQNSIWWIEESKISGIRMDTYPYADRDAMARWIDAVEAEYPGFNIVGECWYANEGSEAFWQRGSLVNPRDPRLPTVMDFRIHLDAPKAFTEQTDPWNGLNILYNHLSLDYLFPDPQKILTFLDNHDTDRFLRTAPDNLDIWKQAVTFLLTSRGIPQIYYGTELLMDGTRQGGDGNVRRDMPGGWEGDSTNVFTRQGRTPLQNQAFDYLSTLLHWRRDHAADVVAKGSMKHFIPNQGIYAYERRLGDRRFVVMLNGNDSPVTVNMEQMAEILPVGTVMPDLISGRDITITPTMTFTPRQILILHAL